MRYQAEELKSFGVSVMEKLGMEEKQAEQFLESLLLADMRGVRSHGLSRFRGYAKRIAMGTTEIHTPPEILSESDSTLVIDAKNGLGSTVPCLLWRSAFARRKYMEAALPLSTMPPITALAATM